MTVLAWVREEFFPDQQGWSGVLAFMAKVGGIWINRGPKVVIPWIKSRRADLLNCLANPTQAARDGSFRRVNRAFKHTLGDGDLDQVPRSQLRWMLTALTALRFMTLPVLVDTASITNPPTGEVKGWDKTIALFWEDLKAKGVRPSLDWVAAFGPSSGCS